MEKLLHFEECNVTFYLISRHHNQPIQRPEFNEVLYIRKYLLRLLRKQANVFVKIFPPPGMVARKEFS